MVVERAMPIQGAARVKMFEAECYGAVIGGHLPYGSSVRWGGRCTEESRQSTEAVPGKPMH